MPLTLFISGLLHITSVLTYKRRTNSSTLSEFNAASPAANKFEFQPTFTMLSSETMFDHKAYVLLSRALELSLRPCFGHWTRCDHRPGIGTGNPFSLFS